MASLFKRGNRYYLAFHDTSKSPQRKQVSLKVSHYRAARKKADQLSREFEEGRYSPWVKKKEDEGDISIGDAIARFVATRQNLSPQSIQKYQSVLGQFLKWAPEKKTLKQVCQDDIQALIDSVTQKSVSVL